MMSCAVHLMTNAVHPSETPDVHDGRCSTLHGKSSAPAGIYAVHLLANTVHQVGLLIYMIGHTVHPSGAPDVLYI